MTFYAYQRALLFEKHRNCVAYFFEMKIFFIRKFQIWKWKLNSGRRRTALISADALNFETYLLKKVLKGFLGHRYFYDLDFCPKCDSTSKYILISLQSSQNRMWGPKIRTTETKSSASASGIQLNLVILYQNSSKTLQGMAKELTPSK